MAHYLIQMKYTAEAWSTLIGNPQNRAAAVESAVNALGGSIESWWLTFGEYDVAAILSMPDAVSAAAFSMAANAGGAVKDLCTTPLYSVEQELEAFNKAAEAGYEPPW